MGSYVVRRDDTVRFCAFDLVVTRSDLAEAAGRGERLSAVFQSVERAACGLSKILGEFGLPLPYVESGWRGRHLRVFFAEPLPAALACASRLTGSRCVRPSGPVVGLDFFAKKDHVAQGRPVEPGRAPPGCPPGCTHHSPARRSLR